MRIRSERSMEMSNKSSSNKDNVEAMYQHQEMKGRHGYEYVVRGAEAFCGHGRTTCVLNLPVDHGVYTSDGRPLITVSDSKLENISGLKHALRVRRNLHAIQN